jgi:hypothetical protein
MADLQQVRIFLSYTRKDMGQVKELYKMLRSCGFSPWMDIFDLRSGQQWLEAVTEAIHEAPVFFACLSNNSFTPKGNIRRKMNKALDLAREKILSGKDVYILPVHLEAIEAQAIPVKLKEYKRIDLFVNGARDKLVKEINNALKKPGFTNFLRLRSQSLEDLSPEDATQIIKEKNFYAVNYWHGSGIHHQYEPRTNNNDKVVIDRSTGLTWQQGGSKKMSYPETHNYIKKLNAEEFAGFNDWRLPTLEETMSLMEQTGANGLHIADVFDKTQCGIWTADKYSGSRAWSVDFSRGFCNYRGIFYRFSVRAVRSPKRQAPGVQAGQGIREIQKT